MSTMKPRFATGVLLSAIVFLGCSTNTPNASQDNAADTEGQITDDHGDQKHADATKDATIGEVTVALAKLSAEDKALAEKQRICPVSAELLGSMGVPIKVDVSGQTVFICCEGCREELLAKPDEYLAKLKQ